MRRRKCDREIENIDGANEPFTPFRWGNLIIAIIGTIVIGIAFILFFANAYNAGSGRNRFRGQPNIMLWSWENPDDLRFVDIKTTGVAFLAATIKLTGDSVNTRGRLQAMQLPDGIYKMAVVRIELDSTKESTFSDLQMKRLTQEVLQILSTQKVRGVQIDFDARLTEREFYDRFLTKLRKDLEPNMMLSMTSLSSWCLKDSSWVSRLPSDEIVPMFFSMGSASVEAMDELSAGRLAKMPMQESIGLSIAEPEVLDAILKLSPHVYVFAGHGWNKDPAKAFLSKLQSRIEGKSTPTAN